MPLTLVAMFDELVVLLLGAMRFLWREDTIAQAHIVANCARAVDQSPNPRLNDTNGQSMSCSAYCTSWQTSLAWFGTVEARRHSRGPCRRF